MAISQEIMDDILYSANKKATSIGGARDGSALTVQKNYIQLLAGFWDKAINAKKNDNFFWNKALQNNSNYALNYLQIASEFLAKVRDNKSTDITNPIYGTVIEVFLAKIVDPVVREYQKDNHGQLKEFQDYQKLKLQLAPISTTKLPKIGYESSHNMKSWHARNVTISDAKNKPMCLLSELSDLKGNALKSGILDRLENHINNLTTIQEVRDFKTTFMNSGEYEILKKGQNWGGIMLGKKTGSAKAVDTIFLIREDDFTTKPPSP